MNQVKIMKTSHHNKTNKKTNKKLLETLKSNKKFIYIFLLTGFITIVIGVLLIPVPEAVQSNAPTLAVNEFQENIVTSYVTTGVTFDNFSMPSLQSKVYRDSVDVTGLINKLQSKISNLKVELNPTANTVPIYNNSYEFTYSKSQRTLHFINTESTVSQFDGFTEQNVLDKLGDILGYNFKSYSKLTSSKDSYGYLFYNYNLKLDGTIVAYDETGQSGLQLTISPSGKLTDMFWYITNLDSGTNVNLSSLDSIEKNFANLKKLYYRAPIQNQTVNANFSAGAEPIDTDFKGTVKITGATIVYLSQDQTSNYVVPTYKFTATFTQDGKDTAGFVYIPAYSVQ